MFSRRFMSLRQAARNTYHRPPLVAPLPHAGYLVVMQLLKKKKKINREAGATRYCQLNNTVACSTVKYSISQIAGYLHARINLIQQRVSKDETVCRLFNYNQQLILVFTGHFFLILFWLLDANLMCFGSFFSALRLSASPGARPQSIDKY